MKEEEEGRRGRRGRRGKGGVTASENSPVSRVSRDLSKSSLIRTEVRESSLDFLLFLTS
jgi:hypothetical protein